MDIMNNITFILTCRLVASWLIVFVIGGVAGFFLGRYLK